MCRPRPRHLKSRPRHRPSKLAQRETRDHHYCHRLPRRGLEFPERLRSKLRSNKRLRLACGFTHLGCGFCHRTIRGLANS